MAKQNSLQLINRAPECMYYRPYIGDKAKHCLNCQDYKKKTNSCWVVNNDARRNKD